MPKLSDLTDYEPPQQERIYVSPNMPTSEDGDYFTKPVAPVPELPADNIVERIIKKLAETEFSPGTDIGNKLAGTGGKERYQLWPEKIIRSALTAVPEAYSGKIPMHDVNPETGELEPSQAMIGRALDMASFAGVGGMGGTGQGGVALGAGPSLRPALKYKDRLYKGKEGQQHMDVIPPQLYPEFQKMAMSGEDISHYNFGFVNDKGHFLSREDALKYGIDSGLIDPQAGKFGALTSTLMADSSKPGTAIEAMAKTAPMNKYEQILEAQRATEGFRAAMRDPATGKIYTGSSHQNAIEQAPKWSEAADEITNGTWGRLSNEWDKSTDNSGFVDRSGKFISRAEAEKRYNVSTMEDLKDLRKSKTAMFRSNGLPVVLGYSFKPVDHEPEF